jgi:diguanylate cyclase (GGDEF)-like protein
MNYAFRVSDSPALTAQASENFHALVRNLTLRADLILAWLLAVEWPALVITALIVSPRTWTGASSSLHPHLLAALLAGPAFILPAILLAIRQPGRHLTRHVLASAQILVSILLIDVTGGRIESHFHIFGSLAILAFYRDWRVLVTASAITAADHFIFGYWWPQSVYGVLTTSPWRWIEHAFWVVFEDFFLILMNRTSIQEMWTVATREAQLSWGAYYDFLTGLPNRRALQERFEALSADNAAFRGAVMFIDLDRFKHANDTLGHTIGDKLLTQVANRLSAVLGPDQMLARIGGDEFIVLLERVLLERGDAHGAAPDSSDCDPLANRLLSAIAQPFEVEGRRLFLSASIGISFYPDHGAQLDQLQDRADRAMYVAKAQGRGGYMVFSSEVARREMLVHEIELDLHYALSRREIRLNFQPLFDRGGVLTGFEALARWSHPKHGEVPPSDFIPMAERSGQILELGEWVLDEACRSCAAWNEDGRRLGIAVNVSGYQFDQNDFPEMVRRILERTPLDPALLTLEITESVLIRSMDRARRHLSAMRGSGIRIALDDFGTGYSSLSYLTSLPADTIKLDRSFLNREFGNADAVIESVIDMAHRLNLSVVAEGVESERQRERMKDLQCDQMQGFFFSPPVSFEEASAIIDASEIRVADYDYAFEHSAVSGD